MNLPRYDELRYAPHRVGEKTKGIHLSRFGASWLHCGGKYDDGDGFITWMMNIPFKNEDGSIDYISQDDAEDAYWMMHCGKMELESNAYAFINSHEKNKDGYIIIKEFYE